MREQLGFFAPAAPDCSCRGCGCTACLARLPEGKTCADCVHWTRTCSWLICRIGTETTCDYIPSRYRPLPVVVAHG